MIDRREVANQAADAMDARGDHPRAFVGFDGFLDSIIHVVDQRRSMRADDYDRIRTIPEFAARCGAAAGRSANLEMVVQTVRPGGNGPLLSSALARLGCPLSYVGAVGREDDETALEPTYGSFAAMCERVIPICPPARTDALEFDDGKIMLGKPEAVQRVTWERIKEVVGLGALREMIGGSKILSVVNWTLVGGVEGIWRGLMDEVLDEIPEDPDRMMFIDLSDPAKRTDEDLGRALGILSEMHKKVPVTLGLNLAESGRVARVLGAGVMEGENLALSEICPDTAERIRSSLGLSCVVVHQHTGAGASDDSGDRGWFAGPYTRRPKISTGAGDHFGGGFAFARALGMGIGPGLALACAVAGAYVRDARSPDRARVSALLRDLPAPE